MKLKQLTKYVSCHYFLSNIYLLPIMGTKDGKSVKRFLSNIYPVNM